MKQMIGGLVPVVVLLGGLFWLAGRFTPTIAPEDVVDLFVDAGIEFTASPTEASLLEQRKIVIGTGIDIFRGYRWRISFSTRPRMTFR